MVFPPVFQLLGAYAKPKIAYEEIKKAQQALQGEKSWSQKALHYGTQAIVLGLGIYTCVKLTQSRSQQTNNNLDATRYTLK